MAKKPSKELTVEVVQQMIDAAIERFEIRHGHLSASDALHAAAETEDVAEEPEAKD